MVSKEQPPRLKEKEDYCHLVLLPLQVAVRVDVVAPFADPLHRLDWVLLQPRFQHTLPLVVRVVLVMPALPREVALLVVVV